jgi:hypothetical protein
LVTSEKLRQNQGKCQGQHCIKLKKKNLLCELPLPVPAKDVWALYGWKMEMEDIMAPYEDVRKESKQLKITSFFTLFSISPCAF